MGCGTSTCQKISEKSIINPNEANVEQNKEVEKLSIDKSSEKCKLHKKDSTGRIKTENSDNEKSDNNKILQKKRKSKPNSKRTSPRSPTKKKSFKIEKMIREEMERLASENYVSDSESENEVKKVERIDFPTKSEKEILIKKILSNTSLDYNENLKNMFLDHFGQLNHSIVFERNSFSEADTLKKLSFHNSTLSNVSRNSFHFKRAIAKLRGNSLSPGKKLKFSASFDKGKTLSQIKAMSEFTIISQEPSNSSSEDEFLADKVLDQLKINRLIE